ncbi:hypothetical protein ACQP3D_26110 [Escherichia coli]
MDNFGLFPKDLQLLELYLLEVVEIGATRSVGSVPAVYQFLSVEQKSKVIFVPRFFFENIKIKNNKKVETFYACDSSI